MPERPLLHGQSRHRPRGGQIWRRRDDGRQVRVDFRRSGIDPLRSTRPHGSGISWSIVAYHCREFADIMHEEDFVDAYEFVSG